MGELGNQFNVVFTGSLQTPPSGTGVPNLKLYSGQNVDGMNSDREKYFGGFTPYNLPELFQVCEKLDMHLGTSVGLLSLRLDVLTLHYADIPLKSKSNSHVQIQCFTKSVTFGGKMPPRNGPANY